MKIENFQVADNPSSALVQFTYSVPRHELALPAEEEDGIIEDVYLSEMLHHILLNHGHRLRSAIFDPLMEGMLVSGEDVIDPALVEELRVDFDCALRARLWAGSTPKSGS
ncbi:hypothetical protein N0B44_13275 [Roseibacterium beibuensis]|uniref:Uncharacterized protein n=1 Tax=[Roseibacterium] beibuensis TaxID=1193142 RepID=A0ABP9L8V3_9RHOB|nr:hypothetical protein [Roseibacterium beibuensis]MCS6623885.1 hypothetical protein [Roseibacterium beibuensis]